MTKRVEQIPWYIRLERHIPTDGEPIVSVRWEVVRTLSNWSTVKVAEYWSTINGDRDGWVAMMVTNQKPEGYGESPWQTVP